VWCAPPGQRFASNNLGSRELVESSRYATVRNATLGLLSIEVSQMTENLPDLGDLELEVMQLIWANDRLTAETVREKLARRLKESTVRTVLRRLEEKRYVTHTVEGRTYVYQATQPRGRVAAKAVQRIVDWFCNGSVEEVLVGMVDSAMLDQRQLRMLADKVAKAKRGK
jgi:BlaI family transcriptional regulator, penicillinase repressor